MWLIDISSGFSEASLLITLLSLEKKNKSILLNSLNNCAQGNDILAPIINILSKEEDIYSIIKLIKQNNTVNRISCKEALTYTGRLNKAFKKIISLSMIKDIDSFSFFLYLFLLILIEDYNIKKNIKFTIPRIGSSSPSSTFNLLEKEKIIIDTGANYVTPALSAFTIMYLVPFIDKASGSFIYKGEWQDPFNKDICIRVFKVRESTKFEEDRIAVIETNIDDSTPEIISGAMKTILEKGALDYTLLPVSMKKGRMGFQVQVLCNPEDQNKIIDLLFRWTSTFGVRKYMVERVKLKRSISEVNTEYGKIRVKKGYIGDKELKVNPEYYDLLIISKKTGKSIYKIYNDIRTKL